MKTCSKCSRVYADDALNFCLDDGEWLVEKTADDEPVTALLDLEDSAAEQPTRYQSGGRTELAVGRTSDLLPGRSSAWTKPILIAVAVLFLTIGSLAYYYYHSANRPQIESIAVLPFQNESGNPDNEYLSDGMTESLIGSLSQIPGLNVKARSSVFRYKGKETDLQTIARELSVQAVLTGRVLQRGEQLILNLELVDPKTENVIWTEQYNRKQSDIVSLQSEIARDVSSKLRAKLSGAEQNQIAKNYTTDAEAYKLYLQGRFFWNKRTAADIKRSIDYFQQAIDKDPLFALAYAAQADSYSILPDYDSATSQAEDYKKARAAANKALEIDKNMAEAHAALGGVNNYEWKFADAEKEYQTALRLDPDHATTHQWYAELLSSLLRHDEAITEAKKAEELDPLSLIINTTLGVTYQKARQLDRGIEQLRKTIEMDKNFARPHQSLGFAYEQKRMFDEAMEEYEKADLLSGTQPPEQVTKAFAERRAAYMVAGWKGVWQKDIEIAVRDKPVYATPHFFAMRYALLGEKDKAFEYLEKAYQAHDINLIYLKVNPDWDDLRDDPRFQELVRKVGFPQ
jgi:TolB-like protein/tetratricopeptide (TPR) repeat protein